MDQQEEEQQTKTETFYDKVQTYYDLKMKYETDYAKMKKPIMKDYYKSAKEKREEIAKLRPKCINCKRPVGTLFETNYSTDNLERHLIAQCGDQTDPCPLKIDLLMGETKPLTKYMSEENEELDKLRLEIIQIKNKLLIGALNNEETLQLFDELKESINTSTGLYEFYSNLYNKIVDNPEMNEHLNAIMQEKYELLNNMRTAVTQYKKTNNLKFIQDSMDLYLNQFIPLTEDYMKKKYDVCEIIVEPESNKRVMYELIQIRNSLENIEHSIIEPKINSFKMGYVEPKMAIRKPRRLVINKTPTLPSPPLTPTPTPTPTPTTEISESESF